MKLLSAAEAGFRQAASGRGKDAGGPGILGIDPFILGAAAHIGSVGKLVAVRQVCQHRYRNGGAGDAVEALAHLRELELDVGDILVCRKAQGLPAALQQVVGGGGQVSGQGPVGVLLVGPVEDIELALLAPGAGAELVQPDRVGGEEVCLLYTSPSPRD